VLAGRQAQIDGRLFVDDVEPCLIITAEVFW